MEVSGLGFEIAETLPCEFVLLDGDLAVAGFNEAAGAFFHSACTLKRGMSFDALSGALWDMAADGGFDEIELLTEHMRTFETCTIDYRRFDQKHYRISVKAAPNKVSWTALVITDISDITESERFLEARVKELADDRSALRSRLRLADAMISERETARLEELYAERLSKTLDSLEDALKTDNISGGFAELEKQREYIGFLTDGSSDQSDFVQRLQRSLTPGMGEAEPKVIYHHISSPGCGYQMENEIIEAAREGVILIALFGAADSVGLSLRAFDGGMELNIHSDGPVVPDYERTEQYVRLRKIARRLRARLETDTTNGFTLRFSCVFQKKQSLPTALVALADTGITNNVCRALGNGAEPMLRCIAASADIDLLKACKEYSPAILIAEADRLLKHAVVLRHLYKNMKIIAVFPSGNPMYVAANSCINGFLSRDIEPDSLRAAVRCVMRGLTVLADMSPVDQADAAVSRYGLTDIERSIISMTGQGVSSEKIAASLHYSQGSLRNMLSAIYEKLGISDKAQLTAFAIFNGFSESFQGG